MMTGRKDLYHCVSVRPGQGWWFAFFPLRNGILLQENVFVLYFCVWSGMIQKKKKKRRDE